MTLTVGRAASRLTLVFLSGLGVYYSYTEISRRREVRRRKHAYARSERTDLSAAGADGRVEPTPERAAAIRARFASYKCGGRWQNPFDEWREQGAWEWAVWKMVLSVISQKLTFNGGLPADGLHSLPVERPDFELLFGEGKGEKGLEESWDRVEKDSQPERRDTFTWIGQSTCFVQLDGMNILTDPVFSHRTIDSMLAPERLRPPGCTLVELQPVDVVLLSHNHFDHCEDASVRALGNSVVWFVPVGMGKWFAKRGIHRVHELDWWQSARLPHPHDPSRTFEVVATPTMHWSARSPLDTNTTLWNSFLLRSSGRSFFHVGDTGYSRELFDAVGEMVGPVDLAAIPIGAYEPEWHLGIQHTSPVGSVAIAQSLRAKKSIAVHWGTWIMSDEAYDQPPKDLAKARAAIGMSEEDFEVVPVGRTLTF